MRVCGVVVDAPEGQGRRACDCDENRVSLSNSSRSPPLKLSMKPFCIGLPGAM